MRITFVTLGYDVSPSGGVKVMYEYANRLVARGHEVAVLHPLYVPGLDGRCSLRPMLIIRLYRLVRPAIFFRALVRLHLKLGRPSGTSKFWFPVDDRVKMLYTPEVRPSYLPDSDVIFWPIDGHPEKGKPFFLVLSYGVWPWLKRQEDAIWRRPWDKIVIARWLYEVGLKLGVPPSQMVHIPIGIDHATYRLVHPIRERPPRVVMLYNEQQAKGSHDGIRALELAKKEVPQVRAVLFGVPARPKSLPQWIEYFSQTPIQELVGDIYNGSSIYLCPSWNEGWHLPPAEAMACGCAVVSTDIGGVRDYAEHGVTALLSPPKKPESLAKNILRLLEDDELRIRLAAAGYERIKEFTWERSTDLLEQFLIDRSGHPSLLEKR